MATKRINFATINTESLNSLSQFNVAYWELRKLSDEFKQKKSAINEKIEKAMESRQKGLDNGKSLEEVVAEFPTESLYAELRKAQNEYDELRKPHKESQKNALALIDDTLYYGYILALEKGSFDVTKGTISVGKKNSEIELTKSYKQTICDFLVKIGCSRTDDEKALAKFVNLMSVRTSGNRKCNKGSDYVSQKSASQYKELFMLNLLQYLVNDLGVLVPTDENNNTLVMKTYDAE